MSYDYSENILIQKSAADLLHDELGWESVYAYNTEQLGETGTLGRKSYKEILLTRYFREPNGSWSAACPPPPRCKSTRKNIS